MGKAGRILSVAGGLLVLVVAMLYMAGAFRTGLLGPGTVEEEKREPPSERTAMATVQWIPQVHEAVGTVRARKEATLSSQVSGRVVSVSVREGDAVLEGDSLVELDGQELQARLSQSREAVREARAMRARAREALMGAEAAYAEVKARRERVRSYFQQEVATQEELEQVEAAWGKARAAVGEAARSVTAAGAQLERARKQEEEARVIVSHTAIQAPYGGQVARRMVDPGDLAWPGKPLMVLHSPEALQLEAQVREGLIGRVERGTPFMVVVEALGVALEGFVEEVVPSGDPGSRSFAVKVSLPPEEGLLPGMFGRLRIPLDERPAIVVPEQAVRRIGQMEVVRVEEKGRWVRLFVKTGRRINGQVEILSGLHGNERVALWGSEEAETSGVNGDRRVAAGHGERGRP